MTLKMFELIMRALFIIIDLVTPGLSNHYSKELEKDYKEFLDGFDEHPCRIHSLPGELWL